MEENNNTSQNQIQLPNATTVLILGIASLVLCYCCGGILGMPLTIVGLFLAKKANKLYNEAPEKYNNYNNLKTGKIICIIGLILNILYFFYIVFVFGFSFFFEMMNL